MSRSTLLPQWPLARWLVVGSRVVAVAYVLVSTYSAIRLAGDFQGVDDSFRWANAAQSSLLAMIWGTLAVALTEILWCMTHPVDNAQTDWTDSGEKP